MNRTQNVSIKSMYCIAWKKQTKQTKQTNTRWMRERKTDRNLHEDQNGHTHKWIPVQVCWFDVSAQILFNPTNWYIQQCDVFWMYKNKSICMKNCILTLFELLLSIYTTTSWAELLFVSMSTTHLYAMFKSIYYFVFPLSFRHFYAPLLSFYWITSSSSSSSQIADSIRFYYYNRFEIWLLSLSLSCKWISSCKKSMILFKFSFDLIKFLSTFWWFAVTIFNNWTILI